MTTTPTTIGTEHIKDVDNYSLKMSLMFVDYNKTKPAIIKLQKFGQTYTFLIKRFKLNQK